MADRKKSKEQIIAELLNFQMTSSILDNVSDMVWVKDIAGSYVAVSKSYADRFGLLADEFIGKTVYDIEQSESAALYSEKDKLVLQTQQTIVFQDTGRSLAGEKQFFEINQSPIYDLNGDVVGIVGVGRDITQRKRTEQQLRYLGYHDMLSGLYNRNYFESFEQLSLAAAQPGPRIIGIIVCDVDGLKIVNDALGHDAGDRRLKYAAEILQASMIPTGFWARIGGDEFAAVIPDATQECLESIVRAINSALEQQDTQEAAMMPLNIAVGYARGDLAQVSFAEIFKEADNAMYRNKLLHSQSSHSNIVTAVGEMLKARDFITEGHADRLQDLVVFLGKQLDFPEHRLNDLKLLGQFHDIGKIGIPDSILFKPGPLTPEERDQMCRHSQIGYNIAKSIAEFAPIAEWVLKHHERWDGNGYPFGLCGEEIPLECRILAIADAYDAMTNDRPYRKAQSHEYAIDQLKKYAGTQFDPELVHCLIEAFPVAI